MYRVAAWLIFAMAFGLMGQEVRDRPLTTEEILDLQHQAAQAEIDREELANLEKEAARAIQTNSGTFFRRVYSEDFTGSLSHGQPVNKAEFISAVQTVDAKYEVFNASDINIRVFKDAAIATCMWSARGVFNGQRFSSQMRAIHVYVNTPRGWRVVAGQITLLPPGAQQPL
jgi:Domain of unknown function (DUF4440)